MQPLYQIISMMGAVLFCGLAAKCVGSGWTAWDIAAFYHISPALPLAAKSSKAAKLFNPVQKAYRCHGNGFSLLCRMRSRNRI